MTIKIIDSRHYHLWSDALHARQLARDTRDEWDRGAYVRWTLNTSWSAFESFAGELLHARGLGNHFRKGFDDAIRLRGLPSIDWGRGIWQKLLKVYEARKKFTHIGPMTTAELRPDTALADDAISVLREGIKTLALLARTSQPAWADDDAAGGWGGRTRGPGAFASGYVTEGGVDPDSADAIRIAYVVDGTEHLDRIAKPGSDWIALLDSLQGRLNVPATAVRAYRGSELLEDRRLSARRGS